MDERLQNLERSFWLAAGNGHFYRRHVAKDGLVIFPAPFHNLS